MLRIGERRFPLAELSRVEVEGRGRDRVFRAAAGDTILAVEYASPADRPWARTDPTYDALDEEQDDFFVMVRTVWSDREVAEALRARWSG